MPAPSLSVMSSDAASSQVDSVSPNPQSSSVVVMPISSQDLLSGSITANNLTNLFISKSCDRRMTSI